EGKRLKEGDSMKRIVMACLSVAALVAAGAAHAGAHVSWSVTVSDGYPRVPVYVQSAPVYVEPAPVYVPAPAYAPAPVAYRPVPAPCSVYVVQPALVCEPYGRWHHHRHHHWN